MVTLTQQFKPKMVKIKDLLTLAPGIGTQSRRAADKSFWDLPALEANMVMTYSKTGSPYAPTEGPIVGFQDELDGTVGSHKSFADGNRRAAALVNVAKKNPAIGECEVPVLIYPAGLSLEEREGIANRARDLTQTKTKHDFYCWGLDLAENNASLGDTDLCRLFGPKAIRSQFENSVVPGSTMLDVHGNEVFKPGLPIDSKDGLAMLTNKQGPIQEITRVRSLPKFAREFFKLHPSESKHRSFSSARQWSQAWTQDLKSQDTLGIRIIDVQSLKELLEKMPDSKLGALVAVHVAAGKPERANARGDGKGAMTSAERERIVNSISQESGGAGTFGQLVAVVIKVVGRAVGHGGSDALEMLESFAAEPLPPKVAAILGKFAAQAQKTHAEAIAKATADESAAEAAKQKAEQAAIKKAKK